MSSDHLYHAGATAHSALEEVARLLREKLPKDSTADKAIEIVEDLKAPMDAWIDSQLEELRFYEQEARQWLWEEIAERRVKAALTRFEAYLTPSPFGGGQENP